MLNYFSQGVLKHHCQLAARESIFTTNDIQKVLICISLLAEFIGYNRADLNSFFNDAKARQKCLKSLLSYHLCGVFLRATL